MFSPLMKTKKLSLSERGKFKADNATVLVSLARKLNTIFISFSLSLLAWDPSIGLAVTISPECRCVAGLMFHV